MAKVLFVDNRLDEVIRQWKLSGCASNHELLPLEPFDSLERTHQIVNTLQPDVVLVGYGLGRTDITGVDVIRSLRQGGYKGYIIGNSGGGSALFAEVEIDGTADKSPDELRWILDDPAKSRRNQKEKYAYKKVEELEELISSGEIERAIEMVRNATDYMAAWQFAYMVLDKSIPTQNEKVLELENLVVEVFLQTRQYGEEYRYWMHNLTHITLWLWIRRSKKSKNWLKHIYNLVFKEKGCGFYYARLVEQFADYADFDDDPVEFSLTPDNMRWVLSWEELSEYSIARIEAGSFKSNEDFLRWKTKNPKK